MSRRGVPAGFNERTTQAQRSTFVGAMAGRVANAAPLPTSSSTADAQTVVRVILPADTTYHSYAANAVSPTALSLYLDVGSWLCELEIALSATALVSWTVTGGSWTGGKRISANGAAYNLADLEGVSYPGTSDAGLYERAVVVVTQPVMLTVNVGAPLAGTVTARGNAMLTATLVAGGGSSGGGGGGGGGD